MTTFFLIRHGSHDLLGKVLAGRASGVHLNSTGRSEAERLPTRLGHPTVTAVYSSPLERARETAAPLAAQLGNEIRASDGVQEVDFGSWTGKSFAELADDEAWRNWNARRSIAATPGGETMAAAQQRVVTELERLAALHHGEHVAIVSHGDLIKAALMHYLGISLDLILRLEISPASVSTIVLDAEFVQIHSVNVTDALS